jgi:bifunctional UDP-N-acetylglucosamine pyrophosphorylase/glucosamine-1-phosphate N-acetyltransferase
MKQYAALILAAGKGTRMKSHLCKVLHPVAGRPIISYVVDAVRAARLQDICVVVGHQADEVKAHVSGDSVRFVLQEPQLGTGHAVAAAQPVFCGFEGDVLILCGDVPLITPYTIESFLRFHEQALSRISVLTTRLEDPLGYGRIVRRGDGSIVRIVEEKDAGDGEKAISEVNTGIYLVEGHLLYRMLERVTPSNAQGEYYLTDIVTRAVDEAIPVHGYVLNDPTEAIGINTRMDLARVSSYIWEQRRHELMLTGVTLLDPESVFVDSQVHVAEDTVLFPGVMLTGDTRIGRQCTIESGVIIMDSVVGDRVRILQGSRLDKAVVEDDTSVGPMAHLRPEAHLGKNVRVGNFVEVKKSVLGPGTKAAHLTYLGDSQIGTGVNIGCGTITCNYDGRKKHPTIIGDRCFVGSDVQFVAPVEIGEGSVIGAGSTITKDVPPKTLAVTRVKQKVYPLRKHQGLAEPDEDRKS